MQQTSKPDRSFFAARLEDWRASLSDGHNAFARRLGISGPYWHQLRTGLRNPGADFMSQAIGKAPEPWKSALKQARQADQEAADAAVLVA